MTFGNITRPIIEAVIGNDRDDRRFEEFAADLFSTIENVQYETTARGGDDGTDARAYIVLEGIARICATTKTSGWFAKATSDIDQLVTSSRHFVRLRICYSKSAKDDVVEKVVAYAKERFPHADVSAHELNGLKDLAFRRPDPFIANYSRELDEQAVWYSRNRHDEDGPDADRDVLRVALSTAFTPDMLAQRDAIAQNAIITSLADGNAMTLAEVSAYITQRLRLSRPPHNSYWVGALHKLQERGYARNDHGVLRLTADGAQAATWLLEAGVSKAMDGRQRFSALLEKNSAAVVDAASFSRLWRTLQTRLANLFLHYGIQCIAELSALAQGEGEADTFPLLNRTLDGLLSDVSELNLEAEVELHVAAALHAMLRDRHSPAFDWLTELGAKYVSLCALGLDPQVESRLRERIAKWTVFPDTHVVLSYISGGDEGHAMAHLLLRQLTDLGSLIVAAEPVLEEASHHANLSRREFPEWHRAYRDQLKVTPAIDPKIYIRPEDNAFIKAFVSGDYEINPRNFDLYIAQFCGSYDGDSSALSALLEDELKAETLRTTDEARVAAEGYALTVLKIEASVSNDPHSLRVVWDGRLLVGCVQFRRTLPAERRLLIVSDSDMLRRSLNGLVERSRRVGLSVVTSASLASALASIPGSSVNLECVRHFLFGAGAAGGHPLITKGFLARASTQTSRLLRRHAVWFQIEDALLRTDSRG